MAGSRGLVVLCILLVPLSGCLGSADEAPDAAADAGARAGGPLTPAAPPKPTATTGSLTGVVLGPGLVGIPDAGVVVQPLEAGSNKSARTDADGRFTIDGLSPGRYLVNAAALEYDAAALGVDIVAGEAEHARLILDPGRDRTPHSVRVDQQGFMSLGAAALPGDSFQYTNDMGDPNHQVMFDLAVLPESLETFMVRITWDDAATALEAFLWYNVTCDPGCGGEHEFGKAIGSELITFRIDRPVQGWPALKGASDTLSVFVWAAATDEQPVSVAYQVPFAVAGEAFYNRAAPVNHTLELDG